MLSPPSLPQVLAAADVVLEVLDARDPQGCRSPQLEAAVRRAGPRQRLVLVLNKIGKRGGGSGGAGGVPRAPPGDVCVPADLVPRDVVAAWLKYLRAEFPTVAFKACTQQQSRNLVGTPLGGGVEIGGKKGEIGHSLVTLGCFFPCRSRAGCR